MQFPRVVVAHSGARVGVAGGDLDVAEVHAGVEHGGDEGYLYRISQSAWQRPVSECEGREARKAKDCTDEKRPSSWPCRTWLTEWRILVRHDAANPEIHRASGCQGSTDNEGVAELVSGDGDRLACLVAQADDALPVRELAAEGAV
jgi:hypothetical protein